MDALNNDCRVEVCPLCGGTETEKVGPIDYGASPRYASICVVPRLVPELWRCGACRSGFVQNVVPEAEALRLYSSGDAAERWAPDGNAFEKPAELLTTILHGPLSLARAVGDATRGRRPFPNVIDIGCSDGRLLDILKSLGCVTHGVEPSITAADHCRRHGHTMYDRISDAVPGSYDAAFLIDVIEHVYDIPRFLVACAALLKRDGLLVCVTGDINSWSARLAGSKWWYLKYPEHVRFPSRQYLKSLPGFSLVGAQSVLGSLGYYKYSIDLRPRNLTQLRHLRRDYLSVRESFRSGDYGGFPIIGKDHYLAVLKKTDAVKLQAPATEAA